MTAATGRQTVRLAVVGAGPRATYAMERLAASAHRLPDRCVLEVRVFDPTGYFGAGRVHTWDQSLISCLNRTSEQVSFAADDSVEAVRDLRPGWQASTLAAWARTNEPPASPLDTGRWLPRAVHGRALREAFETYVDELRSGGAAVHLHTVEVIGASETVDGALLLSTASGTFVVDHALLATGHAVHDPMRVPQQARLVEVASRTRTAYLPDVYPLRTRLERATVPPGSTVGIRGTGLVTIDVVLELTAGRGGRFAERSDGCLEYVASGSEPASLLAASSSGIFPFARPAELAEVSRFVHAGSGRFLSSAALAVLRRSYGRDLDGKLDFDDHVLPVVILEMAYQYYAVAGGKDVAELAAAHVQSRYDAFLHGQTVAGATVLADALTGSYSGPQEPFDWDRLCDPLATSVDVGGRRRDELAHLIDVDVADARRGVHASPVKAAMNGVWRDLRSVIVEAADDGGLTAASAERFRAKHARLHNRFANGASPEVMRMMAALVRSGLLDVVRGGSVGRSGDQLTLKAGEQELSVDVLIEGYLPAFDPETCATPLYRDLIQHGLLRADQDGLVVNRTNHPLRSDGSPDGRLTILGPPLERRRAFQISAMRPGCNHEVMRQLVTWLDHLIEEAWRDAPTPTIPPLKEEGPT